MNNARRAALYRRIEITEELLQKHLDEYYKGGHTYTNEEVAHLRSRLNRLNSKFVEALMEYTYHDVLYEAIQGELYVREVKIRHARSGK
jgi:hypothetical protein